MLWVELDREVLVADQFGVADLFAATGRDDAVGNGEVIGAELLGSFRKQRLPRSGGGLTQLHTANLDGDARPGLTLVGREQGVTLHQLDAVHWYVQLVRNDLAQGRRDAGAEIDLAGKDGDLAGLVDGKERVDFSKGERLGDPCACEPVDEPAKREADDEGAGAEQGVAPRNLDVHVRLLKPTRA